MNRDQAYGVLVFLGSLSGLAVYAWLLYGFPMVTLQITAFLAVAAVLVILAWIGWTMATTPPPEPIEFETPAPSASEEAAEKPAGEGRSSQPEGES